MSYKYHCQTEHNIAGNNYVKQSVFEQKKSQGRSAPTPLLDPYSMVDLQTVHLPFSRHSFSEIRNVGCPDLLTKMSSCFLSVKPSF